MPLEQDDIRRIACYLNEQLGTVNLDNVYTNTVGVYAVGFTGEIFPLSSAKDFINEDTIIFIGKTKSGELSRVINTHFTSGRTGSSTLRRSLGAILRDTFKLKPIPRSIIEKSDRKYSHYKFDNDSENKLTSWMLANLSFSFWEYDGGENLEEIEKELIKECKPILNLKDNSSNKWMREVKELRSDCKELAKKSLYKELVIHAGRERHS